MYPLRSIACCLCCLSLPLPPLPEFPRTYLTKTTKRKRASHVLYWVTACVACANDRATNVRAPRGTCLGTDVRRAKMDPQVGQPGGLGPNSGCVTNGGIPGHGSLWEFIPASTYVGYVPRWTLCIRSASCADRQELPVHGLRQEVSRLQAMQCHTSMSVRKTVTKELSCA